MKPYYSDGLRTIYCGDCREILPQLEVPRDSLLLTDPQYGSGYACDPVCGKGKVRGPEHRSQQWDANTFDGIEDMLSVARFQVIWGGNHYSLPPSRGWLVWYKPDAPPSMASAELAWTNRDMNTRILCHSIAATNAERVGHPTQKPLRLMQWCLSFFPECHCVVDTFLGTGTGLVAAKQNGLWGIGIELEERYAEIAAHRLEQECLFDAEPITAPAPVQLALCESTP